MFNNFIRYSKKNSIIRYIFSNNRINLYNCILSNNYPPLNSSSCSYPSSFFNNNGLSCCYWSKIWIMTIWNNFSMNRSKLFTSKASSPFFILINIQKNHFKNIFALFKLIGVLITETSPSIGETSIYFII